MYNKREYQITTLTGVSQTTVFTGRGTLHGIIVGSSTVAAIKIGDAITGTSSTVGVLRSNVAEGGYFYDCIIANGLQVTLDSTVVAAASVSVLWCKG